MEISILSSDFSVTQIPQNESYLYGFAGWLETTGNRGRGRAERSVKAHLQDVRQFSRWFEMANQCTFSVDLVTATDLRAFYQHSIEMERCQPATWNRRRASLALLCQWGQATGCLAYNPFQGIPVQQQVEASPRWLREDEYRSVMRQTERAVNAQGTDHGRLLALRDRAMVALMVLGALRVGEVCDLRVGDLLLATRKGAVLIRNGKGGKARSVPLGLEARKALSDYLGVAKPSGLVFDISTRQVERRVREIGRAAGIDLTPHRFRHTGIRRLYLKTLDLTACREFAGHARIDVTAMYARAGAEDLEQAVEGL